MTSTRGCKGLRFRVMLAALTVAVVGITPVGAQDLLIRGGTVLTITDGDPLP